MQIDFIRSGKPVENGVIESFNGRLRDQCLNRSVFTINTTWSSVNCSSCSKASTAYYRGARIAARSARAYESRPHSCLVNGAHSGAETRGAASGDSFTSADIAAGVECASSTRYHRRANTGH